MLIVAQDRQLRIWERRTVYCLYKFWLPAWRFFLNTFRSLRNLLFCARAVVRNCVTAQNIAHGMLNVNSVMGFVRVFKIEDFCRFCCCCIVWWRGTDALGASCCPQFFTWRVKEVPPRHWYLLAMLYRVTSQKSGIFEIVASHVRILIVGECILLLYIRNKTQILCLYSNQIFSCI
jgi:hypothetical protein